MQAEGCVTVTVAVCNLDGPALMWAWRKAAIKGHGYRLGVTSARAPNERRAAVATYLGDPISVPTVLLNQSC